MTILSIGWHHRSEPLIAGGLFARAEHKQGLLAHLQKLPETELSELRGSHNKDIVIILGDTKKLPWVPGCHYIGQDSLAKHLWLPTNLEPNIPIDLLDNAVCHKFGEGQYIINPWDKTCYPVTQLLSVSHEQLKRIC